MALELGLVIPNPVAVPLLVMVAPESITNDEPDKILKLLAVILKSSAPAISKSIWSSVGDEIVVSPSVSKTKPSAKPLRSIRFPLASKVPPNCGLVSSTTFDNEPEPSTPL